MPPCLRSAELGAVQIANKELLEKRIPFTIRRYLPDGRCAAADGCGRSPQSPLTRSALLQL